MASIKSEAWAVPTTSPFGKHVPKISIRPIGEMHEDGAIKDRYPINTPASTGIHLSTEAWGGERNFRLDLTEIVDRKERSSGHPVFSKILNKLYVDMNKWFNIRFALDSWPSRSSSFLRATMVYPTPTDNTVPVTRCPIHSGPTDPLNMTADDPVQWDHLMWTNTAEADYQTNQVSGRQSLVVPLGTPHAGCDYVTHTFKFTCIGSCVGGINRRPTTVIFTLEQNNNVVGRQYLDCRICSCPIRDRNTHEAQVRNDGGRKPRKLKRHLEDDVELIMNDSGSVDNNTTTTASTDSSNARLPLSIKVSNQSPPASSSSSGGLDQNKEFYMVPVCGYENFKALNKFAQFLDSQSEANKRIADYPLVRATLIEKHNNITS